MAEEGVDLAQPTLELTPEQECVLGDLYDRCAATADLVCLEVAQLTVDGVSDALAKRYGDRNMYSAIGDALVAVNPYETIQKGGASTHGGRAEILPVLAPHEDGTGMPAAAALARPRSGRRAQVRGRGRAALRGRRTVRPRAAHLRRRRRRVRPAARNSRRDDVPAAFSRRAGVHVPAACRGTLASLFFTDPSVSLVAGTATSSTRETRRSSSSRAIPERARRKPPSNSWASSASSARAWTRGTRRARGDGSSWRSRRRR